MYPDLDEILDAAGGVDRLAHYLEAPKGTIEVALRAPAGERTERVRAMVAENTWKLLQMPSQGGFFWRLTRRRVVKDWEILARWSAANAREPQ